MYVVWLLKWERESWFEYRTNRGSVQKLSEKKMKLLLFVTNYGFKRVEKNIWLTKYGWLQSCEIVQKSYLPIKLIKHQKWQVLEKKIQKSLLEILVSTLQLPIQLPQEVHVILIKQTKHDRTLPTMGEDELPKRKLWRMFCVSGLFCVFVCVYVCVRLCVYVCEFVYF